MNTMLSRLFVLLHIATVAATGAVASQWSDARADDIDLFFAANNADGGTPNVLLILDNSTSMSVRLSNTPPGSPSRGDILRDVTGDLLASLTGVDVGIMTYNGQGASVRMPMRPLDAPALGSNFISARVREPGHDAAVNGLGDPEGDFFDFYPTNTNTSVAPVYKNLTGGTDPIIPGVDLDTNTQGTTVTLEAEVVSLYTAGPKANQIIEVDDLEIPGQPGTNYAPLVTHFDGAGAAPVLTMLRFNLGDLSTVEFNAIKGGCVVQAHAEFTAVGTQPDPGQASRLRVNVSPREASSPVHTQPTALPVAGNVSSLTPLVDTSEVLVPQVGDAAALRWDRVPGSDSYRTPDIAAEVQQGLTNPAYDPNVDTNGALNDYLWVSLDSRTEEDAAAYGYAWDITDANATPPPTREIYAHNTAAELNPSLRITYHPEPCRSAAKLMLGAIFADVRIPKGATIADARLRLSPVGDYLSAEDFRMNVYVGRVADPATHGWDYPPTELAAGSSTVVWIDPGRTTRDPGSLVSSRTSAGQWLSARDITSPDLSRLVQSVVNGQHWCGGQALIVYVEPRELDATLNATTTDLSSDPNAPAITSETATENQLRSFHLYESSPSLAPKLEVSFVNPPTTATDACNVYSISIPVGLNAVDINNNISRMHQNSCWVNPYPLYYFNRRSDNAGFTSENVAVDMITFRDVPIEAGADILSARLYLAQIRPAVFLTDGILNHLRPRSIRLRSHVPTTASEVFGNGVPASGQTQAGQCAAQYAVSNLSSTPIVWDFGPDPWDDPDDPIHGSAEVALRVSPDITPLLQASINGPIWAANPHFTLFLNRETDAAGDDRWFDKGLVAPVNTPVLRVELRTTNPPTVALLTHRQQLADFVNTMEFANTGTPFFSPLREAVSYFRNDLVYAGRRRAPGPDPDTTLSITPVDTRLAGRVSSEHSHDGTVTYPAGCESDQLSASPCINTTVSTGARYQTGGVTEPCESNHIILLSDGAPTAYTLGQPSVFESWVNGLAPALQCGTHYPCVSGNAESEAINKLASYVSSPAYVAPDNPGNNQQPLTIHTVGFNVSSPTDASHILARGILETLADAGGGDFYLADEAAGLLTALRRIFSNIGVAGASLSAPSLTINAFNSLFTLDEIYISMFAPDANEVVWPGNIKKYRLRNTCPPADADCTIGELLDTDGDPVLTETQTISPLARSLWSTNPDGAEVTAGGAASVIIGRGLGVPVTDAGSTTPTGTLLRPSTDYRIRGNNQANLAPYLAASANSTTSELIAWWRGRDRFDEDEDGDTNDRRWPIQDSLHTNIVPVIFGYDASRMRPVLKLFATSNTGEIRMINGENGREQWRYIPRDHLARAVQVAEPAGNTFPENPNSQRMYGIDGEMSRMIFDCNRDGIIERGANNDCSALSAEVSDDRVLLFATQRRGGDKIYAFEAYPATTSALTDAVATNDVVPRFLWTIDSSTPGYSNLGQTWSRPVPMRIHHRSGNSGPNSSRLVVGFAAGYDTTNDQAGTRDEPEAVSADNVPALKGASIYLADMFTGECVLHIGPVSQADCDYSTVVSDMKYSIPMTPGFLNSNLQTNTPEARGVDRFYFADLGGQVFRVDLNQSKLSSTSGYAVVKKIATLGQDDDSNSTAINRRQFYTSPIVVPVRGDYTYSANDPDYDLIILASGNRPSPRSEGVQDRAYVLRDGDSTRVYDTTDSVSALTHSDLVDATGVMPALADLRTSSGFYLNFDDATDLDGEKVISLGVVLAGIWFFTTFSPETVTQRGLCSAGRGVSRFYAINILDAAPAIDRNEDGLIEVEDRSSIVSTGLVSDIATAFLEGGTALLVNAEGGSRALDTGGVLSNLDVPVVQSRREW